MKLYKQLISEVYFFMITRKDYFLVSIIGFFFGLLLLPVLNNIKLPFLKITFNSAFLIVVGFVLFANFALWLVSLLSRLFPLLLQIAKFVAVGGLNTLLDWGILNTLIFLSGIAAGWWYSIFKSISFIVAVINSYFWNKYWTFQETQINTDYTRTNPNSQYKSVFSPFKSVSSQSVSSQPASLKEFARFFVVSLIGFGINIGIASFIVNVVNPINLMRSISSIAVITPERWANIGAFLATIFSLVWNFIGYKFIVFRK